MTSSNDRKGPHKGPFFAPAWNLGRLVLTPASRPLIMGIINLTPDSFYDGGRLILVGDAMKQAAQMIDAGADVSTSERNLPGQVPRPSQVKKSAGDYCRPWKPFARNLMSPSPWTP